MLTFVPAKPWVSMGLASDKDTCMHECSNVFTRSLQMLVCTSKCRSGGSLVKIVPRIASPSCHVWQGSLSNNCRGWWVQFDHLCSIKYWNFKKQAPGSPSPLHRRRKSFSFNPADEHELLEGLEYPAISHVSHSLWSSYIAIFKQDFWCPPPTPLLFIKINIRLILIECPKQLVKNFKIKFMMYYVTMHKPFEKDLFDKPFIDFPDY